MTLSMSQAEATVLHELIAGAESENALTSIELAGPVDQKVLSDVQQALAPLVPGLGADGHQAEVDRAYAAIDPGPFRTPCPRGTEEGAAMDKRTVARELAAVIADEIEAQRGVRRPVGEMPPLIADAILDAFCVERVDEAARLSVGPGRT
ncbi:hypothetical protein [Nocardiopsis tropica]|uniref:DUF222 domain-containing protein n=1 Tax=Nocardiopsis tropica TaxID=109330 RepID=A0ABU7KSZ6_9ACTN|nr:hypothetical protein [Nocardiopsis umidischolae]MEE2052425.1 hypothetical protein [Nocardiopsis umidischolae]